MARRFTRKKVCYFCTERDAKVDYKEPVVLRRFISDQGKIMPRRITGACARHQRQITNAVKQARNVALLPYTTAGEE